MIAKPIRSAFFAAVAVFLTAAPFADLAQEPARDAQDTNESKADEYFRDALDYRKKMEERQEQVKALMEEGKKIQSDYQNPMLSTAAKTDLQKKMDGLQRKLYALQQEMRADDQHYQEELADLQQRLFKIEKKDVEAKIAEFAKEQGYDLIVDVAACGFSKPDLDVTEDVLKKMGVKNPKTDK